MAEFCKKCEPHPRNTGLEYGEFCEGCGEWGEPPILSKLINFIKSIFNLKKTK